MEEDLQSLFHQEDDKGILTRLALLPGA